MEKEFSWRKTEQLSHRKQNRTTEKTFWLPSPRPCTLQGAKIGEQVFPSAPS